MISDFGVETLSMLKIGILSILQLLHLILIFSIAGAVLENPLDCKAIQPVHPKGGQSWVFIGRTDAEAETPILWPPHAKS